MIICPSCGRENLEGLLFCEECGKGISGLPSQTPTIPTRSIVQDPIEASSKGTWGSASLGAEKSIYLHIRDAEQPLKLDGKKRIVFGRSDIGSDVNPDIDLTPFGAVEKGVSRQHAVIERGEDTLMLLDAGSSNGTFLNGQRLQPNQPRILRDGDEVRLGKLMPNIYFK